MIADIHTNSGTLSEIRFYLRLIVSSFGLAMDMGNAYNYALSFLAIVFQLNMQRKKCWSISAKSEGGSGVGLLCITRRYPCIPVSFSNSSTSFFT
jgi:hypothetical protein